MSSISSMGTRPVLGWALAGLVVASGIGVHLLLDGGAEDFAIQTAILLTGLVGAFLVGKRPRHPVSWLLVSAAAAGLIAGLGSWAFESLGVESADDLSPLTWLAFYVSAPGWFAFIFIMLGAIPLLFPTGRPPSPRWNWVLWAGIPIYLLYVTLWVLQEQFCDAQTGFCIGPNPIGVAGVTNPEEHPVLYLLLACALGALVSMVVRFRRSGGVERQQIKALLFTVTFFFLAIIAVDLIATGVLDLEEPEWFFLVWSTLWVSVPLSIALAILRYRLYEIDRIVSRTVAYALVVALLAVVFAGGILGVQTVLPASDSLAVAGSTLAVAALFNPLRKRVRALVDHKFNRSAYDAEQVVESFSARLQDSVDLDSVSAEMTGVVSTVFQPAGLALWLRDSS